VEHREEAAVSLPDYRQRPYLFLVPADVAAIYNTPNAQLNPAYTGRPMTEPASRRHYWRRNFTMQDVANYRAFFLNDTSTAHLPT